MKTILPFLILYISNQIYAQSKICDSIPWSINYKLKWNDFEASPDTTSEFGAISSISLGYRLSINKVTFIDLIEIEVKTHFYPCMSWKKPSNNSKIGILHEQTHFDIAQYYKRFFVKRILESQFTRADIANELEQLYNTIIQERAIEDKTYDEDTDFSRNRKRQIFWSTKYNKLISSLKNYDINTLHFELVK